MSQECKTSVTTPPPKPNDAQTATYAAREPFTLVIFGASGDLARRKLIPAIRHLEEDGFLPEKYAVVGFSRSAMTDDAYRDAMGKALAEDGHGAPPDLLEKLYYVAGDNDDAAAFARLDARLTEIEKQHGLPGNRMYYMSVAPEFFAKIAQQLAAHGMIRDKGQPTWSRLIIEKPFGRDLESARSLNSELGSVLHESQIYRIDHYLGKETVQNLFSFRFGNSIFEPLFNQKYVEHVQITVGETLGMEGKRGGYYDTAGALRDMVQNHLLQLLTIIAMEPPSSLDARSLRDEKVKVLRSIDPLRPEAVAKTTARGQYSPGGHAGQYIKGYREEENVNPKSNTETFVALKLSIDNWRWAGVPFYLRTGKRLRQRVSEIAVTFKQPPLHLFRELAADGDGPAKPQSNVLLLRIQPNEGISLTFAAKQPGMSVSLDEVRMDFAYSAFHKRSPEAYERLLLDALRGDASLFTRADEVEFAWQFISSIQAGWARLPPPKFPNYAPLSDGPEEAFRLFDGWRPLSDG
ncbi:MAG: glucose-6-phosphate dehydrogenase [Polyangiales bacterium]